MATIRLQGVTKVYPGPLNITGGREGTVVALDQVNLTIPDGQTLAVVGPSGCGKTTLLRVVAGLETGYTGRVLYDDQDMANVKPGDRYIGMVFQNYALYPHFEGLGNLRFFFQVHRAPDAEAEERVRVTSEIMGFGFDELLKRKPGTLSGGQQQRLAIARALVRKPRLFLFDEPLSNLDAKLRVETRVEIKRLLQRFRITAIYVTHDQVEAVALGDRIAVMRDGRIEQLGSFQELREAPVNIFVAGFLGSPPMTLVPGGEVADGAFRLGEIAAPLPEGLSARLHPGQKLVMGIRPEAARLAVEQPALPGVHVRGSVVLIEPDFARRTQLVHVQLASFACAASGPLDTSLNVGDTVEVIFPLDRLYFFDAQTGQRL